MIEGCYGDLVETALPFGAVLRFLNPGVAKCIVSWRNRPWEPSYCASTEEQARLLKPLIVFVLEYETRKDDYGLRRHRALSHVSSGMKREYLSDH